MTTPKLNLKLPSTGARNTAQALNDNFAAIETACAPLQNVSGNHGLEVVNGELRAKVGSGIAINANGELQGPSASFSNLADVQVTNPINQQYLMYKGGKWVNSNGASIGDVPDIVITNPQVGDYLRWNGQFYENVPIGTATAVGACQDVQITSLANNDMLFWNGSKFVNRSFADVGIADLEITNPQVDDVLIYNGTKWVNQQVSAASLGDAANGIHYADSSSKLVNSISFASTGSVGPAFSLS